MPNKIDNLMRKYSGQYRVMPVSILETLRKDFSELRASPYRSGLTDLVEDVFFSFDAPEGYDSVVIAAIPNPYVNVRFQYKGSEYIFPNEDCALYTQKAKELEAELDAFMEAEGYRLKPAENLPQKLLAARSGLSAYGRNNVTYIDGMGSFIKLVSFYTDMPSPSAEIFALKRMESCENCGLCVAKCPTRAILEGRHIIDAERCLTYLNEFIDLCDFPDWLAPDAHNCLHGCIVCQSVCPKNRKHIENPLEPVVFDETETQLLLDGATDSLTPDMAKKVALLNLGDYLPLMPRNLAALLSK